MRPGSSFISFSRRFKRILPVAPVSLPLPALHFCDPGQKQLVGIAFSGGLGEAFTLLLQQVLKRARLGLAALGELDLDFRQPLLGQAFKGRQQIGDVALDQPLYTRRCHSRRRKGIAKGVLELVEGTLLSPFFQRAQRLAAALGLGPNRGDGNDLFVQPSSASAVDGKTPHEHDTRLRPGTFDHGNPR